MREWRGRVQLLTALRFVAGLAALVSYPASGQQVRPAARKSTQIVLLGTGTPRPDPKRSGPATAIMVNGAPYLIDAGPGIVRRVAAVYDKRRQSFCTRESGATRSPRRSNAPGYPCARARCSTRGAWNQDCRFPNVGLSF